MKFREHRRVDPRIFDARVDFETTSKWFWGGFIDVLEKSFLNRALLYRILGPSEEFFRFQKNRARYDYLDGQSFSCLSAVYVKWEWTPTRVGPKNKNWCWYQFFCAYQESYAEKKTFGNRSKEKLVKDLFEIVTVKTKMALKFLICFVRMSVNSYKYLNRWPNFHLTLPHTKTFPPQIGRIPRSDFHRLLKINPNRHSFQLFWYNPH